jgi:hypothetical protein
MKEAEIQFKTENNSGKATKITTSTKTTTLHSVNFNLAYMSGIFLSQDQNHTLPCHPDSNSKNFKNNSWQELLVGFVRSSR